MYKPFYIRDKNSILPFILIFFVVCLPSNATAQEKGDSLFVEYGIQLNADATQFEDSDDVKTVENLVRGDILILLESEPTFDDYEVKHKSNAGYVDSSAVSFINDKNRDDVFSFRNKKKRLREQGFELLLYSSGEIVNSADGVSFYVNLLNNSKSRTIKYIRFYIAPFNPVGDMVKGDVQDRSEKTVRAVGPIKPDNDAHYEFDNVWYNATIECVEIRRVDVEYMDGHEFVYINDLSKILKEDDVLQGLDGVNIRGDCSM